MQRTMRFVLAFAIGADFSSVAQAATTWTVNQAGEPAALDSASCTAVSCTLRDAINSASSGDTIKFASNLDGATISLTMYSNCLSATDVLSTTCLPQSSEWTAAGNAVTQFGPSAFYIPRNFSLTIDAATGMSRGVAIMRDVNAADFRLFDVGAGATLNLTGLRLGNGFAEGGHGYFGGGALGAGGAIFNQGSLNLSRCTLDGNVAKGGAGGDSLVGIGGGGGAGQAGDSIGNGGGPNGGAADITVSFDAYGTSGAFGGGGGYGASTGSTPASGTGGNGGFGGGGGSGTGRPGVGGFGGFGGGGAAGESGGSSGGFGAGPAGFVGGGGAGMGGAIFNDGGSVTLINATLGGNVAQGGGVFGFSGNGLGYGGAVFNYSGTLTIDFSTLSRNNVAAGLGATAGSSDGGAIYNLGDAATATLTITHSIVANSTGTTNDISTDTINGGTSNYTSSATTLSGSQALGSLASGGGLEAVMIPSSGSPAVNAVACTGAPATDQRGVARPQPAGGSCDIGAVERKTIEDTIFLDGFEGY
jgi:hypothetical protein